MNFTAVTEEVNRIKSRPNLLLWYTGDEPDGTSDPQNATSLSRSRIISLDGGPDTQASSIPIAGYHPVSLVLNCQDYAWSAYAAGADIVMQDTYMIGNNVTFSVEWDTVCTRDYGCCGCDNCVGNFEDIGNRMSEFEQRIMIEGPGVGLGTAVGGGRAVWTVPQGFGESQ